MKNNIPKKPIWFVVRLKQADMKEKEMLLSALFGTTTKIKKKNEMIFNAPRTIPTHLLRPGSRFKT